MVKGEAVFTSRLLFLARLCLGLTPYRSRVQAAAPAQLDALSALRSSGSSTAAQEDD